MRITPVILVLFCSAVAATSAYAEKKPIIIGQQVSMDVEVIVDTVINKDSAQLVLNPSVKTNEHMSENMPDYCLLNAGGQILENKIILTPGNIVCVTDDKRILEGVVEGTIENLPGCDNCDELMLMAGDRFPLSLSGDVSLILQIRADGQNQ